VVTLVLENAGENPESFDFQPGQNADAYVLTPSTRSFVGQTGRLVVALIFDCSRCFRP
jgi:hypothetical protein